MSKTRTYLNILVQLARVDGVVVQEEIDLINQIGKANSMSDEEITQCFDEPGDVGSLSHLTDDEKYDYTSVSDLTDKFVKVIVVNKTNPAMFEKFIDKIQDQSIHELKIAENFDDILTDVDDDKVSLEDTTTLLDSYVEALNTDLSKDKLKTDMRSLYNQAQALELV